MGQRKDRRSTADLRPFQWDKLRRRWGQVRTPRQALMRLGKDVRPTLDRAIARYSEVGDPAVFDPRIFPFTRAFEERWERIRQEAEAVMARGRPMPQVDEISPDHARIADGDGWRSYFLVGYGDRRERACRRCPETAALLETVPNLHSAFFSIMDPGQRLVPHRGPTKAILTWHLPLSVPHERERCRIRIAGDWYSWREGESLLFDDTYRHEVRNDTGESRVLLLMHLRRPVRFPGSLVSNGFLGAISRSPFVQDARRNQDAWEDAFEAADPGPGSGP
ncbi:MAG: aspartyl/asparaginyl beta-hydroxylase domain-containing protein [Myxococcota bacterium]